MTRDEIMALTDEQLRIEAAELNGFKRYMSSGNRCFLSMDDLPTFGKADGTVKVCPLYGLKYVPDYPNDIAAAMELLFWV